MYLVQSEVTDALVFINGICVFQTETLLQMKSSQSDQKDPSKGPFFIQVACMQVWFLLT